MGRRTGEWRFPVLFGLLSVCLSEELLGALAHGTGLTETGTDQRWDVMESGRTHSTAARRSALPFQSPWRLPVFRGLQRRSLRSSGMLWVMRRVKWRHHVRIFKAPKAAAPPEESRIVDVLGSTTGLAQGALTAGAAASRPPRPRCANMKVADYWDSIGPNGGFLTYGCLQVSGIHVAQTHLKTVVIIDRTDATNTKMVLPSTGRNAYAEEITLSPDDSAWPSERALDVKSNTFCSTGQFLPDGTLASIGGSSDALNADQLLNGSYSIRLYKPCRTNDCQFQLSGLMTSRRWYPTAQLLPDGRVLIVGGANTAGNIAINDDTRNNPTIEYYPRKAGEGNHYIQFLKDTVPFNLYPFVHLLPSGKVFIFAQDAWTLFDTTTNQEIMGVYPKLSRTTTYKKQVVPIFRSYPVSGTSALFPLSSSNNYTAEIMICGGNNNKATYINGDRGTSLGANGRIPADYACARIKPEVANPQWVDEYMCYDQPASWNCTLPLRRLMGDMVILADGTILIVNGATQGYQGLNAKFAQQAQLQPLIYNTSTYSWYPPANLPPSLVPRMYHSSAILLHDATVLLTGSNPNVDLNLGSGFPTEFRMEKFMPPYLYTDRQRPQLLTAPKAITAKSVFSIAFNTTQKSGTPLLRRFQVFLAYPGFSTHNQRHGMRHLKLDIAAISVAPKTLLPNGFYAIVKGPPSLNLAPPTMYWLHVLDDGVPNREGLPVNMTAPVKQATRSQTVTF